MKKNLTVFVFLFFVITLAPLFSQWVELTTGVTARLNSLSSIKEVTTWACGVNGTVIKSSDRGESWENGNLFGIGPEKNLNHIYAISPSIVFAAGNDQSNTYLYKTIDGGVSWDIMLQQAAGKFNAVHFIDQNTGILIGDAVALRWSIWKTTNGGNSWDSTAMYLAQNNNEKGFNNSLWATGNNIWFGTDNFSIYRTFNFGSSWNVLSTGAEKNSATLWFDFDFNIGLSGNLNLIKTINSGNSWFVESVPGSGNIAGVTGSAHSRFNWSIREDKIYVNPHNENIWRYDYTSPAGNYTYVTIERNGYFGGAVFAARDNGGISRTYFLALGIISTSGNIPSKYSLLQNYPNPFNPTTRFKFEIVDNGMVNITIFDALGREIEILVQQELKPGVYEAEWNAANYPSGVYFYRLSADNFSKTKSMVLVK